MTHRLFRPSRGLTGMTRRARIRNPILGCSRRRDEPEGVRVHHRPRNAFGFDGRHVTGNALAPSAFVFVMGVFRERGGVRPVRRRRPMAVEANLIGRLS